MFDYRFNGLPNMLTAHMPFMPQNMLSPMAQQSQQIDPTATAAIPQQMPQAPAQVPQGDMNYFPPQPDANAAPITPQDYQASLSLLQPQQRAPQSAPAMQPQQPGGGMEKIAAFLQGLGSGNGVLSAIGGGMGAVNDLNKQNQTVGYLTSRGIPEGEAQLLAQSPQATFQVLQNLRQGADPKAALELQKLGYEVDAARLKAQGGGAMEAKDRYMTVGKQVFDKTTGKLVELGADGMLPDGTEFGVSPVFGVDADGNTLFAQLGKDGSVKVQKVDGFTPLSPGDKASDSAQGKARGEARASLPTIEGNAGNFLSMIKSLEDDPYLDGMLGPLASRLPNVSAKSERVQAKMDQIKGQTFLQAFNSLRGGGAITEIEGQKATEALARLNAAQNPTDYRQALTELRTIVQNGLQKARKQAGSAIDAPVQATPAQQGGSSIVDYSEYFRQ